MSKIIQPKFFNRDTLKVAEDLLGHFLVCDSKDGPRKHIINEVEAYIGPEDQASHASAGKTERTKTMFGPPGTFYVYLIYGMYWMLNVVTEEEGHPSAVLIRGVGEMDGPGKLTRGLGIEKSFNGKTAEPETGLWLEKNQFLDSASSFAKASEGRQSKQIERTPRIGVDYAGEWAEKPFRFVLK